MHEEYAQSLQDFNMVVQSLCLNTLHDFGTIVHSSCLNILHEFGTIMHPSCLHFLHDLLHGFSTEKARRKHGESTKKARHLHDFSTTLHELRVSSCQAKARRISTKFARLLHVVQSSCQHRATLVRVASFLFKQKFKNY